MSLLIFSSAIRSARLCRSGRNCFGLNGKAGLNENKPGQTETAKSPGSFLHVFIQLSSFHWNFLGIFVQPFQEIAF